MLRIPILAAWLAGSLAVAAPVPSTNLLPQTFAGWIRTGVPAAVPNPGDDAILHEYGLDQSASATYASRTNQLTVRAWRFGDATGAYGAFTLDRQPTMRVEAIGHDAAASGDHFLFWKGITVVEVSFAHPTRDERADVTALAAQIPPAAGDKSVPPSLPSYLPTAQLDPATVRYAIGPLAYARMGGALPAEAVGFSQDAEVVVAQYGPPGAQATLTLIMYPTPQIAGAHLKAIDDLANSSGLLAKRSGPLVAVLSGSYPASKAQQLLSQVRFNDYVTINHPEGYISENMKLYRLLMGITVLVVILVCAALLLGFFLGGGRALIRVLRGKPVSSVTEEEFISLHLNG